MSAASSSRSLLGGQTFGLTVCIYQVYAKLRHTHSRDTRYSRKGGTEMARYFGFIGIL